MIEQTQIYGVVLPVHIAQQARVVAAMNGKSRSSLMRDLLLDYLEKSEPVRVDPSPIMPKHKSNKRAKAELSPMPA